jgi:hypothetical protein
LRARGDTKGLGGTKDLRKKPTNSTFPLVIDGQFSGTARHHRDHHTPSLGLMSLPLPRAFLPSITARRSAEDKAGFASLAARARLSESTLPLIAIRNVLGLEHETTSEAGSPSVHGAATDRITIKLRPRDGVSIAQLATKSRHEAIGLHRCPSSGTRHPEPSMAPGRAHGVERGSRGAGRYRPRPDNENHRRGYPASIGAIVAKANYASSWAGDAH